MKKLITLILFAAGWQAGFGQSLVGSAGEVHQSANAQLSFSVGELAIATYSGPIILTQGFQQGELLSTGIADFPHNEIGFYPNPTSGILFIKPELPGIYSIELFDLQGRTVYSNSTVINEQFTIDLASISLGTYAMRIVHTESGFGETQLIQKIH
jgi:hypothetical protein